MTAQADGRDGARWLRQAIAVDCPVPVETTLRCQWCDGRFTVKFLPARMPRCGCGGPTALVKVQRTDPLEG